MSAPYFALVLCDRRTPTKQWVAPPWPSRPAIIRAQAVILCRPRYANIKPLYRLRVALKALPHPTPAGHRPGLGG